VNRVCVPHTLLGVASLRVVDAGFSRVDVDHSPDDGSSQHLPQRLRRLEAMARRNRHPPRRNLLRAKLRQPTRAECLDGLREQPAQLLDRLRLTIVLSEVLVD